MPAERTLSIIMPDATRRNIAGRINTLLEQAGLRIVAQKMLKLTPEQAQIFYAVHKNRHVYSGLCRFISSGPIVVQVLEGEDAVARNRQVMGAANPAQAAPGTIRKEFAESIEANSVYGSDSPEIAAKDITFFFGQAHTVAYARRIVTRAYYVLEGLVIPNELSEEQRDLISQLRLTVTNLHRSFDFLEETVKILSAENVGLRKQIDDALPIWKQTWITFVASVGGGVGGMALGLGTAYASGYTAGFIAGVLHDTFSPGILCIT